MDYEVPLGPPGRLSDRLFARRRLEETFDHRTAALAEVFPGA